MRENQNVSVLIPGPLFCESQLSALESSRELRENPDGFQAQDQLLKGWNMECVFCKQHYNFR